MALMQQTDDRRIALFLKLSVLTDVSMVHLSDWTSGHQQHHMVCRSLYRPV